MLRSAMVVEASLDSLLATLQLTFFAMLRSAMVVDASLGNLQLTLLRALVLTLLRALFKTA
jgi:hypothetical protein